MSGTRTINLNNLPGVCFDLDIRQHLQQDSDDATTESRFDRSFFDKEDQGNDKLLQVDKQQLLAGTVSSKHRIASCRASWRAFYIQQPLAEVFSDHQRPFHRKGQFEENRPCLLANELEHDYDQAAEFSSSLRRHRRPRISSIQRSMRHTQDYNLPYPERRKLNQRRGLGRKSRDARDEVTRAGGLMNDCATEGNARDSRHSHERCSRSRVGPLIPEHAVQEKTTQDATMDGMADQELAVQLENILWRQFQTGHGGLLSVCERRQIGMHSCYPENSLNAEDKDARNTPLVR